MQRRTENTVVKAIMQYLKCRGYLVWRQNSTGVYDAKRRVFRKTYYGMPGIGDIFCVAYGRFYSIECKSPKGKQTPEQKSYEIALTQAKGFYILARSVDDVINGGL